MTLEQAIRKAKAAVFTEALAVIDGKSGLGNLRAVVSAYRARVAARPKGALDTADIAMLRAACRNPLYPRKTGPNRERAERLADAGYMRRFRGGGFGINAKGFGITAKGGNALRRRGA